MKINKYVALVCAVFVVAGMAVSLGMADSTTESAMAQDTKKIVQNNFVETAQKGLVLSGYVDTGYSYNFTGTSQSSSTGTWAQRLR
ncbi:MAG: hypothetical protein EBW52_06405 [Betaproteobacteria bacterium]|nr:hypothetical protein [Betaproteobacteria bacterium]